MHKWAQSDSRAADITSNVAEMIAVDCQPMSIVDDIGFTRVLHVAEPSYTLPCRKYLTDTVIPRVYSELHMKQRLKQDVFTQWNSTLQYMLQSIIAQKAAFNTE
uniref:Uncharacterized protein n=1 Tax=Amphimedon queenslandica TaxID=400682 RepID=A0A1X7TZ00_AMPQE